MYNMPTMSVGEMGKGKLLLWVMSCTPQCLPALTIIGQTSLQVNRDAQTCTYGPPHNPEAQKNDPRNDNGSMKQFFKNLAAWMVPATEVEGFEASGTKVGTNIGTTHAFKSGHTGGSQFNFFLNPAMGMGKSNTTVRVATVA